MTIHNQRRETLQNQVDLIINYYSDAITFVEKAKKSIANKDYETSHNCIENAYQIICLMHDNLKVDTNEELSIALNDHYDAVEYQLNTVQMNNCSDICNEIIEDLNTIKDSWKLIAVKRSSIVAQIATANENEQSSNH